MTGPYFRFVRLHSDTIPKTQADVKTAYTQKRVFDLYVILHDVYKGSAAVGNPIDGSAAVNVLKARNVEFPEKENAKGLVQLLVDQGFASFAEAPPKKRHYHNHKLHVQTYEERRMRRFSQAHSFFSGGKETLT